LTAHGSVQGATFGSEQHVRLGKDLLLAGGLVRDHRLDYVALGHIHKAQNLNEGSHPPIVYSGSIERVDFGEVNEEKSFVIARIERGKTNIERRILPARKFFDKYLSLKSSDNVSEQLISALPPLEKIKDAIVRLTVEYPRDYEPFIDEIVVRNYAEAAFEFHLVRRPKVQARVRLPHNDLIASLTPLELLEKYLEVTISPPSDFDVFLDLAKELIEQ
jgi:exonuclease SbcD